MVDPNVTEQFFSEVDIPKLSEDGLSVRLPVQF